VCGNHGSVRHEAGEVIVRCRPCSKIYERAAKEGATTGAKMRWSGLVIMLIGVVIAWLGLADKRGAPAVIFGALLLIGCFLLLSASLL
jgi:hypothetical protein